VANINLATETECSSEIMLSAKKEPEEHDYGVRSLETLSGDVMTPGEGDRIQDQDLDGLAPDQYLGSY
jgi:hypothetical protein